MVEQITSLNNDSLATIIRSGSVDALKALEELSGRALGGSEQARALIGAIDSEKLKFKSVEVSKRQPIGLLPPDREI